MGRQPFIEQQHPEYRQRLDQPTGPFPTHLRRTMVAEQAGQYRGEQTRVTDGGQGRALISQGPPAPCSQAWSGAGGGISACTARDTTTLPAQNSAVSVNSR